MGDPSSTWLSTAVEAVNASTDILQSDNDAAAKRARDRAMADATDREKQPFWYGRSDLDLDIVGRPLRVGS